ncbi:MAG: flavin reductase [Anaerolineae bacterium]|jgi:flavin reductase (DIM6/NTAB) family NADH-FMN oxidoreductase RutF|nr:flavin reductase [Anaerolineae bacterium]
MDIGTFKQIMSQWASGVTVITTQLEGQYHGMTASSFASLSLEPLLVTFNMAKSSHSFQIFNQTEGFVINILSVEQSEIGRRFAGLTTNRENRFEGIAPQIAANGGIIVPGAIAWLECRTYQKYEGGDHVIFLGEVINGEILTSGQPLVYYHRTWGQFTPLTPPQALIHVVMFKLHEPTLENLHLIRESLLNLKTLIPQIQAIEVGINAIESARAYDLVLTVRFKSVDDLNVYQIHPEHQQVVNTIIKPRAASIVAVDYHTP